MDIKRINRMSDIHKCSEFIKKNQEFVDLKDDGDYISATFPPDIVI